MPTRSDTRTRPLSLMLAVLVAAITILAVGCDSKSKDDSASQEEQPAQDVLDERTKTIDGVKIRFEAGPRPTAETVLARAGDLEVTLDDFERAMQRSLLVAPKRNGEALEEVPARRLASPQLQIAVVRRLLADEIVTRAAENRGIEVDNKEIVAALESHPKLKAYADLVEDPPEQTPPELEERGLTVDDLRAIARDRIRRQKLQKELIEEITKEELREIYMKRKSTVKLVLASVRNTPRSATIDAYVRRDKESETSAIEEHFEANKSRYRRPKMVEMVVLAPARGESAEEATLSRAAERLEDESDYETIADELGLELDDNAQMVRQENSAAFKSDVGSTGYQMSGPRGAYAWRVTGVQESQPVELSSGLRRQIAAQLLREGSVVPTAAAKLTKMRQAMKNAATHDDGSLTDAALDSLRQEAEDLGLDFHVTESFAPSPRGSIPGVGLAPDIVRAARDLTMDQPLIDRPILSRNKAYMVRLQDKHVPTPADFEAEAEAFEQRYLAEQGPRIVDKFVARWENEHEVQLDTKPLRIKYGVVQKE